MGIHAPKNKIQTNAFCHIRILVFLAVGFLFFWPSCQSERKLGVQDGQKKVELGIEVFIVKHLDLVQGKRVGLVTNPTGVSSRLESSVDLFFKNQNINLVALYGPEHGVRGNAQAGEYVPYYIDKRYDIPEYSIPVFSLYGQSLKPEAGMFKKIDEYMRSFDTKDVGKVPEQSMV